MRLRRLSMNSPLTGKVDLGLGRDLIFFLATRCDCYPWEELTIIWVVHHKT